MSQPIQFSKLSGSGNDFVCISNLDGRFDPMLNDAAKIDRFARAICRRGLGVGADGLIFASPSEIEGVADVSASFFEPDGSEAELCGNGTACFVKFLIDEGHCENREIRILTPAGVVLGRPLDGGYVRACIPMPTDFKQGLELQVDDQLLDCDFAITGVPHLVAYVDDVEQVDMPYMGPQIRYHAQFQPRGTNANFVQVLAPGKLAVRTWEFGVEGETLACGTGSATAAITAARRFNWPAEYTRGEKPIEIRVRSGDVLRVWVTQAGDQVVDLCLDSRVRPVFRGTLAQEMEQTATAG